jgi:hypothetical protein
MGLISGSDGSFCRTSWFAGVESLRLGWLSLIMRLQSNINHLSTNNCTIRINCRSVLPYICFGRYVTIIRGIYIYIYIYLCTSLHAVHFVFYWCCYTLRAVVCTALLYGVTLVSIVIVLCQTISLSQFLRLRWSCCSRCSTMYWGVMVLMLHS